LQLPGARTAAPEEMKMLIQVNTDGNVLGGEALSGEVERVVTHALAHLSERISRVEVHLSDEDGPGRAQDDQRCLMEARVEGLQPGLGGVLAQRLRTWRADDLQRAVSRRDRR
jgi:hypothetical protein